MEVNNLHISQKQNNFKAIKIGIWLYFLLLIFEGALRKWFLSEFANPILLIRDPLAIWLILQAYRNKISFINNFLFYILAITIISFVITLFFGHGNFWVDLYGARIFIIHFPLIFIIGKVFTKEDVVLVGKCLLWLSIPMAVLIIAQFFSPQTAWVNKGVGNDINGGGFSGAMGYLRPPGTFSFTSGTSSFFCLVGVFVFYFWAVSSEISGLLLLVSSIALFISIPFTISRSLVFQILITFGFVLFGLNRLKSEKSKSFIFVLFVIFLLFALSSFDFFSTGIEVFKTRFDRANEAEGGIESVFLDRYLGGMINALYNSMNQPFFGLGLGYGTNVGSTILTNKAVFLISEGEWGRLIGEFGPLFGIILIILRLSITASLCRFAWKSLRNQDILPWIILSYAIFIFPQGGLSQPTSLGFCVLVMGLLIASLKTFQLSGRKDSIE